MDKCKKIKFATEKQALLQLKKINEKPAQKKKPTRAYECFCGSWHLTSRLDVKDIQTENDKLRKINQSLVRQINDLNNKQNKEFKLKIAIDEVVLNQRKQIKKLQEYIKKLRDEIVL